MCFNFSHKEAQKAEMIFAESFVFFVPFRGDES